MTLCQNVNTENIVKLIDGVSTPSLYTEFVNDLTSKIDRKIIIDSASRSGGSIRAHLRK